MQLSFTQLKIFVFSSLLLLAVFATVAQAEEDLTPVQHDFLVTSVTKDKAHPYYDQGHEIGFAVNGVPGASLTLERGKTYTFGIDTGVQHDFYLSTKSLGWGTATLTQGIKGNYTYKGTVTFTPTADTPDVVYYSCRNHKYMGGEIHIVDGKK